jgi:DNA-binding transcriptional regulator YiaG
VEGIDMNERLQNAKSDTLFFDITPVDMLEARIKGEIACALQKYRMEHGFTQKEFAGQLHVSQAMLSRWENAEENLTVKTIAKILSVLDMTINVDPERVVAR